MFKSVSGFVGFALFVIDNVKREPLRHAMANVAAWVTSGVDLRGFEGYRMGDYLEW